MASTHSGKIPSGLNIIYLLFFVHSFVYFCLNKSAKIYMVLFKPFFLLIFNRNMFSYCHFELFHSEHYVLIKVISTINVQGIEQSPLNRNNANQILRR